LAEAVRFSLRHPVQSLSMMAVERRGLQRAGRVARVATPFALSGMLATAFIALTGHPEGMDIAANAFIGLGLGEAVARFARNSFSRAMVLDKSEKEFAEQKGRHTALLQRFESTLAELDEAKKSIGHTMLQLEFQQENAAYRVQTKIPGLIRIERLLSRAVTDIKALSGIVKDEKVSPRIQSWIKMAGGEIEIFNWQIKAIREEIEDLQVVANIIEVLKRTNSQLPDDGYISVDTVERPRHWGGGMGETDVMFYLHGDVFVIRKKLLPEYATNAELTERFIREAKIAKLLDHPNIAKGYGHGQNVVPVERAGVKKLETELYLMTEFVRGKRLDELIYTNPNNLEVGMPLAPKLATAIGLQILSALEYMHTYEYSSGDGGRTQRGLIHRDLKPGNVMISLDRPPEDPEYVKVIDMGIAREVISAAAKLTQTGHTMGTPAYMAPEQIRGAKELTGMVDIYALGAIMYEMYEGRILFPGFERPDVTEKIMKSRLIPQGMKEIITAMLNPRREDRPAHADIREALEQTLSVLEATVYAPHH
jgi:serine/threonine protein kinase